MRKFMVKVQWSEKDYENWVVNANSAAEAINKALAESVWEAKVTDIYLVSKVIE